MRRLATALFGLIVSTLAPQAMEQPIMPMELIGAWGPEVDGACETDASGRAQVSVTFGQLGASLAENSSDVLLDYSAFRRITPTRWYINVGPAGSVVLLDVNLVSPNRLLIAHRPLGEAVFLTRCEVS